MTKEEIYEKLETEVKLRGLSPKTYITYKNSILKVEKYPIKL